MISKEAIRRGYNRGNYTVGAPTVPPWAAPLQPARLFQPTITSGPACKRTP